MNHFSQSLTKIREFGLDITKPLWCLLFVLIAIESVLLSVEYFQYRNFGLIHDAPLMHYIGQQLLNGLYPYTDIFDMNYPLVYWIHATVISVLGPTDTSWRNFDTIVLSAICILTFMIVAKTDWRAGLIAVLWLISWHLNNAPFVFGQRDMILSLFILSAASLSLPSYDGMRRKLRIFFAGVALGFGILIKPTTLLLFPLLLAGRYLVLKDKISNQSFFVETIVMLGGGASVIVMSGVMLAWQGSLGEFLSIQKNFISGPYKETLRLGFKNLFLRAISWELIVFPFAAMAIILTPSKTWRRGDFIIFLVLFLFGVLHFWLQGKGWQYHYYPYYCASIILTMHMAGTLCQTPGAIRVYGIITILLAVMLQVYVNSLHVYSIPLRVAAINKKVDFRSKMISDLERYVPTDYPVQPFDTTLGAVDALYRTRRKMPTRFLYDFPFFLETQSHYIKELRAEFLNNLLKHSPNAIIVTNQQWPQNKLGFDRLDNENQWPDLHQFLQDNYKLVVEYSSPPEPNGNSNVSTAYRIYVWSNTVNSKGLR